MKTPRQGKRAVNHISSPVESATKQIYHQRTKVGFWSETFQSKENDVITKAEAEKIAIGLNSLIQRWMITSHPVELDKLARANFFTNNYAIETAKKILIEFTQKWMQGNLNFASSPKYNPNINKGTELTILFRRTGCVPPTLNYSDNQYLLKDYVINAVKALANSDKFVFQYEEPLKAMVTK